MAKPEGFERLLAVAGDPATQTTLVVTGAGISLASGIPTFRGTDPGAVWANEVTEKGTYSFFERAPHESWQMYLKRFEVARAAKPNAGHLALREWEQWLEHQGREFLLVTQNVDSLHEQAGSRALVKVHGSLNQARCIREDCAHGPPRGTLPLAEVDFGPFHASPSPETVPLCPVCGSKLRPHVLWFDEYYSEHASYEINRVYECAYRSQLVVFVGTSFSVGVTARVTQFALRGNARLFSIDPSGARPERDIDVVAERAEVLLPRLVSALKG
jgi:NAD-dependent SIR2 family protein deacetylase